MNPAASSAVAASAPLAQARAAAPPQAQPFRVAAPPDSSIGQGGAAAASDAVGTRSDRKAAQVPVAGDGSGMLALIASALAASVAVGHPIGAAGTQRCPVAEVDAQGPPQRAAGAAMRTATGPAPGHDSRPCTMPATRAAATGPDVGGADEGLAGAAGDAAGSGPALAGGTPPAPAAAGGAGIAPPHPHPASGSAVPQPFAALAAAALKAPDLAGAAPAALGPARAAASLSLENPQWPQALADRVQWQLDSGVHEVRLELHPQDLGSLQVQIRVDNGAATVEFRAAQPQAREALATGLPQLRALLGADGLSLLQARVGGLARDARPSTAFGESAAEGEALAGTAAPRSRVLRLRLLDDFA